MSFDLSFSPEFYYSEDPVIDLDKPYSVEMAIHAMSTADHVALAQALGIDPKYLTTDQIMELIRTTNTCTDLTSPVEVWIDSGGYHKIDVHEAPRHIPDLDSPHAYTTGNIPSLCGGETGEVVAWLDRDFVANCAACKDKLEQQQ